MGKLGVAAVAAFLAFLLLITVLTVGSQGPSGIGPGLPGVVCAPPGGAPGQPIAGFANDQLVNAAAIVAAGQEIGAPARAQVIAVAAAMQESTLRNLPHGDRDSIGLFQQRTSWGPNAVRMDPKAAAKLFYARLLAIPGWQQLPLTVAAQRVQISALPDAYAKWEAKASQVVGAALGIVCQPGAGAPGQPLPADPLAALAIARAVAQVGVPYAWGGGNAAGPTLGISDGGGAADRAGDSRKIGFDCSGLMVYAYAGIGITVPHQTQAIWASFQPAIRDRNQVQPGDMIMLSSNGQPGGIDHVGLYLGNGQVVHAPESGSAVRIVPNIWASPYWTSHFIGALRPTGRTSPRNG
jgi:cell wall-associated NlpC family hydrolase